MSVAIKTKNKKPHTKKLLCFIVNGWTGDWMGRRTRRWKGVLPVSVPAWTVTRVTVDLVFTAPSVLTGTTDTLVDVCGDERNRTVVFEGLRLFLH